jgi:hypothetical protein
MTEAQTCPQCGHPIGPEDLVCQRCGAEPPRSPPAQERQVQSESMWTSGARLAMAKMLAFFGGAIILVSSLAALNTPFFASAVPSMVGPAAVVEALLGSLVIVCGMMASARADRNVSLGAAVFLFSALCFVTPFGGLFFGPTLGVVGGLLIVGVKPE